MSVAQASNGSGVAMVNNVPVSSAESGSTVRFTPQPVDHTYRFTGWASAMVAGLYTYSLTAQQLAANPLDITMPAGAFVLTPKAFEKYIYNVSVSSSTTTEDGSTETEASTATVTNASGDPITEAEKTSSITFTATPGTFIRTEDGATVDYEFTGWTASGYTLTGNQSTTTPLTISMPSNDVSLTANFMDVPAEYPVVRVNNTLWATTNLGMDGDFCASPTDYGALYQWGYNNALDYVNGTSDGFHTSAFSGSVWNGADGTANQGPCPTGWRLPTQGEIDELLSRTYTTVSKTYSNVSGVGTLEFTTTSTDSTYPTKTLVFPDAGYRSSSGTVSDRGARGYCWSSTPGGVGAYYLLFFSSFTSGILTSNNKGYAFSVRCVRSAN